jgi:hypothetical protein
MKKTLLFALALIAVGCAETAPINVDDPNIEQIKDVYMAYVQDFIDNDFEGIASHFQTPVMRRSNWRAPTRIALTPDELMESYRDDKANIQEGYKYSTIDRIDVHKLASTVYYADVDFTRYNHQDEVIFQGRSLYYFANESGSWKMFAMGPVERD